MAPALARDSAYGVPARHALPLLRDEGGRYELAFVRSSAELRAVQRLRFEVFNLELDEGFLESFDSGLDQDEYDIYCHHLVVRDRSSSLPIGTYRMQTAAMARRGIGFYSATEFDFTGVPPELLDASVELGRACIHRDHRSLRVLYMLWRGLGTYVAWNNARYVLGCCSLTSQNPEEGRNVMAQLEASGTVDHDIGISPLESHRCYPKGPLPNTLSTANVTIPRLMRAYISLGARICGAPAIDRDFKTIDFLALFDVQSMDARRLAFYGCSP